ncbi:MAG: SpoIIE family protein phosphatase [Candidatus Sabulitectum sp.]|nr:SpoIIE family protein phosphatase [Candidatus Sabulitectum sp.]
MSNSQEYTSDILWRILDVTRELSSPIDLDEMLVKVVDVARDVLKAERGTVFLYDSKHHELYAEVGTGLAVNEIRFPADQGIAGICASSLAIVNVPDAYSDKRFNSAIDKKMGYLTRCILSIPLVGLNNSLVGVLQLINKRDGVFTLAEERVAEVLASQCAVALQRAQLLEEFLIKQKFEHDLNHAREIQKDLLPEAMPVIDDYDLAGWNEPADQTGGDIFDAVSLTHDKVLLLLADAAGHGLGPALTVIQFRAMIRIALSLGSDLCDLSRCTNNQLVEDLSSDTFITAFVGLLDTKEHVISYHACGQAPLLHYHGSTGKTNVLSATALPFGVIPDMPLGDPGSIVMEKGDIFALISDGIFEQANGADEQFGVERTIDIIRRNYEDSMQELTEKIFSAVARHSDVSTYDDDMTIMLVKRSMDKS